MHNLYVYQIIMLYTLNILQFYFINCTSIKLKEKRINAGVKSGKDSVNEMTKSSTQVENNVCGRLQGRYAGEGSYCLGLGEKGYFTLTLVQ